jgi:hypothetical protein
MKRKYGSISVELIVSHFLLIPLFNIHLNEKMADNIYIVYAKENPALNGQILLYANTT